MTDRLPPPLLALFQARPPLRYLPPCDLPPSLRKTPRISGVARYVHMLADYDKDYQPTESWLERRYRRKEEKRKAQEEVIQKGLAMYRPRKDPNIKGDPFRTLFVSRLSYTATEQDLMREFARYGVIDRVRLVTNARNNKPTGYAFIVFQRERDMKAAFKEADGMRIKDRRVLVDVERGRTVNGWKPRRLGGGLGGRGYSKQLFALPRRTDRTGRDRYRGNPSRALSRKERSGGAHGNAKASSNEHKGSSDKPRAPRAGIGYKGSDKDLFKGGPQESSSADQNGPHPPDVSSGAPTGPSGRTSGSSRHKGSENYDSRPTNNMNYSSENYDHKESDRHKSDHDDRRRDHDDQSRDKEKDRSSKRRRY